MLRYGNVRELTLGLEVVLAEGALGADEQVFQVVAGIVLAQRRKPVPGTAVRQHRFEAERELAGVAVAQHRGAAGVGREIAADLARSLGAEAQREHPVIVLGDPLQVGQNASGIDGHGVVEGVDGTHFVHPRQIDDHFAISDTAAA